MRKIELKHDLQIPGYGYISAGTKYKVNRFNKRYVYVNISDGVELRLARKADCKILY